MAIVTLTINPAIDLNVEIDSLATERKLRCQDPSREPGGGGINAARVISRLGGECRAYFAGGGATGELMSELLQEEGVPHERIPVHDWVRENIMVRETSGDQQYRLIMPGPELSREEWEGCLEVVTNLSPAPEYLIASGSLPPGVPDDFYARLAEVARKEGIRLIVDTGGTPLKEVAEAGLFLLKPNIAELEDLVDRELEDQEDIHEAARYLVREARAEVVVLSRGAGGARFFTEGEEVSIGAPTVPEKSSVGAGDTMVGAMVLSLQRGDSIQEAVEYGVAAGASTVMTPGTELCRREDTDRLIEEIRSS